jgi:spore germination cell wall hydrolase CwlJ-like protein
VLVNRFQIDQVAQALQAKAFLEEMEQMVGAAAVVVARVKQEIQI